MGNFWGGLARANEPMNVRLADGSKDVPHCLSDDDDDGFPAHSHQVVSMTY